MLPSLQHLLLFAAAALLVATCLPALAQSDVSHVREGRALYEQHCVSCHGLDGKGDGPAASALKVHPGDLTRITQKNKGFPREKILEGIEGERFVPRHGNREMPVWGKRFRRAGHGGPPTEIEALVAYLESIQK